MGERRFGRSELQLAVEPGELRVHALDALARAAAAQRGGDGELGVTGEQSQELLAAVSGGAVDCDGNAH
jgi:hypothetical protein